MKLNCWDFVKCGREVGGAREAELGRCPAFTFSSFHGTNGGFRGGRYCWYMAGTHQQGNSQCTQFSQLEDCSLCDFFQLVKEEEGQNFQL